MTEARRALGAAGEERAARWYAARGYQVIDRNWRCHGESRGEIDLVAWQPDTATVVFCEVKTRRSAAFGTGLEAVTPAKQARLRRLAARWLQEHAVSARAVRFDVAAVTGPASVEVVAGAF